MRPFHVCVVATALTVARFTAFAQTATNVRGVVRDSASGAPIGSAVVMELNARGESVARAITRENGAFRVARVAAAVELRIVRLGFRAVTVALPAAGATSQPTVLDVHMTVVPRALKTVDVVAARGCLVRADRGEAFALLDQAREGLLATIVARERQPAFMRVLRFERRLDLDGIEVVQQTVHIDSSLSATTSFNASRTVVDFVAQGFRTQQKDDHYTYYGPDADVLLDARFQSAYCFGIAARDTAHVGQVGLHFSAASHKRGRVDIAGTIWIDSTQRELRTIEFTYDGIDQLAAGLGAGGTVSFRTLPNGAPTIDKWFLRLIGGEDTLVTDTGTRTQRYSVREVGGELAQVRWPDEQLWSAPLSTLHITAVTRAGTPARGAKLNLVGTDYRARTDSLGRASIEFVLPGPYRFVVDDDRVATIGLQLPTTRTIRAQRSSSSLVQLTVPSAEEYVAEACGRADPDPDEAWILARVMTADAQPATGAKWRLSASDGAAWRMVSEGGITGSTGLLQACRGLRKGSSVELAAWRDPSDAIRVRRTLSERLSVVRLPLPAQIIAARKQPAAGQTRVVAGVVRDSAGGAPVADARVTFLGTPFEGATDSTGRFTVGGLSTGVYTVEISTPWLDSVGGVSRQTVNVSDSANALSLFAPKLTELMAATCGADDVSGAVVGRVAPHGAEALPRGLRVIAEWSDDTTVTNGARARWLGTPVEASGTYRLCGVPSGRPVVMRTENDSTSIYAAKPLNIQVAPDRKFARADLMLDTAVLALPTFSGTVLADTVGSPIENAEIVLSDIGRSVLTDKRGMFRMTDVPIGSHLVSVRRVGYSPMNTTMNFDANRTVDQKVLLPLSAATLATIDVTADGVPAEFEERSKRGFGRFLTQKQLARQDGRRLSDVLSSSQGFASINGHGSAGWIIGKRAPLHIKPKGMGDCGTAAVAKPGSSAVPCEYNVDDVRDQGIYCPSTPGEVTRGVVCGCYSQVYMDARLLNPGRPTEPFDINTIPLNTIAALEFYASAAETPGKYSDLNAVCGVMLVWSRK